MAARHEAGRRRLGDAWACPHGRGRGLTDRGPRAAAGGGQKKECPALCSGPAPPTPHPLPLRLGLLPGPGSAPLGLATGAMGAGCGGPHGADTAEAGRPRRGRSRSGGIERARLILGDILPVCPHHYGKGIPPSPDDSCPARAEDEANHLYHLPTTSPKPGNVDGIKTSTT